MKESHVSLAKKQLARITSQINQLKRTYQNTDHNFDNDIVAEYDALYQNVGVVGVDVGGVGVEVDR